MAVKTSSQSEINHRFQSVLKKAGFTNIDRIATSLQGSIWRGSQRSNHENIVIKITSKYLHKHSITSINSTSVKVQENILGEASIMKYLAEKEDFPSSIVKYHNLFESKSDYYLMMEDGGGSLFDFMVKASKFVQLGMIDMAEWHKVIKVIFKQMIECIEFLHKHHVCHFDISLENFLINDVPICTDEVNQKILFILEDVQIKLCDFGLAELFKDDTFKTSKWCGKTQYKSPECIEKKKGYNAQSNDIWCLGICLFMMVLGTAPWAKAKKSDPLFALIMNGGLLQVLEDWDRLFYVNVDLIHLFEKFFKFEDQRITLNEIKKHSWLSANE